MLPIPLFGKVLRVPKSVGHFFQKIDKIIRVMTIEDMLFAILDVIIEKVIKMCVLLVGFDYSMSGEYELAIMHELWMLP